MGLNYLLCFAVFLSLFYRNINFAFLSTLWKYLNLGNKKSMVIIIIIILFTAAAAAAAAFCFFVGLGLWNWTVA